MSYHYTTDELYHYGILGMRWGVRRSRKELARAQNSSERDEAVSKLNKHREKGTNKMNSLSKRGESIRRRAVRNETIAAIYARKAARERMSKYSPVSLIRTPIQKRYHEFQATRAQSKSSRRMAAASRYNALSALNQKSINAFQKEINKIDKTIAEAGKRFINES